MKHPGALPLKSLPSKSYDSASNVNLSVTLPKTMPSSFHVTHIVSLVHSVRNFWNRVMNYIHKSVCKYTLNPFFFSSWWPFQNSSYLQNCVNFCILTSMSKITCFSWVKRKPHQEGPGLFIFIKGDSETT